MKKIASIFICTVLAACVFAGCQSGAVPQSSVPESKPADSPVSQSSSEAPASSEAQEKSAVTLAAGTDGTKHTVFVKPEWLKSVIDGNEPESADYVVIEGSWGPVEQAQDYLTAHIPGAVHVNTDDIESEEYWNIRTPEEIEKFLKNTGITKDTTVIVYGKDSGSTRIAFVCLWAGVEDVKVLDGGLKAWQDAGYEVAFGEEKPTPAGDFGAVIPAHPEYVISMPEEVLEAQKDPAFRLVSIRSQDEFEGKVSGYSYIERTGEPKGAVWGHDEFDYYNEDGTFISFDNAVKLWEEQGLTQENQLSFYCGTGWRATIPWLMCYENGWKNATLFDGGWFAWQMQEELPVQAVTPEEAAAAYTK